MDSLMPTTGSSLYIMLLANQPDQKLPLPIAWTNLTASYFALNNIEAAEAATKNALDLTRQEKIPTQEAVALGHLGLIRARQGRIGDALHYLHTAVSKAEDLRDLWNAQHWYRDIANLYTWTGLPELALENFEKALALSRKVGDHRSEGICLFQLRNEEALVDAVSIS